MKNNFHTKLKFDIIQIIQFTTQSQIKFHQAKYRLIFFKTNLFNHKITFLKDKMT